MVLLDIIQSITSNPSTSIDLLLSKSITFPLLCLVIYKTIAKEVKHKPTDNKNNDNPIINSPKRYNSVESEFQWTQAEPYRYRPFKKGEYKLVMGIHNIEPDEWFLVENTYKDYTTIKYGTVSTPNLTDHCVFMTEDCIPTVIEFYQETTKFMLERYPMCFKIDLDQGKILNLIRGDSIPLDPYSIPPKELLHCLSRFIEEDFILMFPDPKGHNTDEYIFKGGVFAFAAGFDPIERFQKPLTEIHGPVPEYRTKLRSQMNKFFEKLKPGLFVKRNNWSIQTHNKIFVIDANKGTEDEEIKSLNPDHLDFKRQVYFRSERQVLTRLPKTQSIVFSIRTYLTPMWKIREEGLADELVGGIQGMQEVIGQYKRRPEWGDAVVKFMNWESDGCDRPEIGPLHS
ncbi:hypothetical protein BN7_1558 [Wickerhamomyces ciferrii]|uniref:Uncharacterized protein n=1 Tax=Wickerhamomyces ciferrii (strain ATCC 14091 / BCRC 22168 / CBS 111 / JCM 3599 / NBRC 0793 / NRRL Y-1031 F-60-10) TaxID=1206466 RepID=K0KKM7_WICCF|nr:uncharacterized protein BN7_1558 [Wickerhamomyces ciferrii]CCH42019.1 hypothetical protein BN7_1558 [Wickerhamomyces ciferrii]